MDPPLKSIVLSEVELWELVEQTEAVIRQFQREKEEDPLLFAAREVDGVIMFFEGETIMVRGTVGDINAAMLSLGLRSDDYRLTEAGERIFFTQNVADTDTLSVPLRLLTHEDLPFGFAGDGVFRFSSAEISSLSTAPAPLVVDGYIHYYSGDDWTGSLEDWDSLMNDRAGKYKPGFQGWCYLNASDKQTALNEIAAGRYPFVTFKMADGSLQRIDFVYKESLLEAINEGRSFYDVKFSPFMGNYFNADSRDFVGWSPKFSSTAEAGQMVNMSAPLLVMPPGQMSSFEVNPAPQQPYLGAEGVYPVVLVEFMRDVVLQF